MQATAAQTPSAVAQFTGRSKGESPSPVSAARSTTTVGRVQTASTAAPSGTAANTAGSSDRQDVEVAAAISADLQTGNQNASSQGQDASASAASLDGSLSAASFAAPVQSLPADAPASSAASTSATVANLSAQIAQKAGGQTTRFDVQLDPVGLGRVNVSVEIDAKGAMSAALSFEKPEAASLLKSHAAELQQSLAQAGFDLSNSALSFSTVDPAVRSAASQTAFLGAGADGSGGQQSQGGQAQNAGRAFGAASLAAAQADQTATAARTLSACGLDIRI